MEQRKYPFFSSEIEILLINNWHLSIWKLVFYLWFFFLNGLVLYSFLVQIQIVENYYKMKLDDLDKGILHC